MNNTGTITGMGAFGSGVYLTASGTVNNQTGGSISGTKYGVRIAGASGTVTNAGQIIGQYQSGVYLGAGGSVTNQSGGSITGSTYGVSVYGTSGTVTNAGTITGTNKDGVYLRSRGNRRQLRQRRDQRRPSRRLRLGRFRDGDQRRPDYRLGRRRRPARRGRIGGQPGGGLDHGLDLRRSDPRRVRVRDQRRHDRRARRRGRLSRCGRDGDQSDRRRRSAAARPMGSTIGGAFRDRDSNDGGRSPARPATACSSTAGGSVTNTRRTARSRAAT